MTAYKKKLYAFQKSIQLIENSAQNNYFSVSDETFQALYNTYDTLKELFSGADELKTTDHSAFTLF